MKLEKICNDCDDTFENNKIPAEFVKETIEIDKYSMDINKEMTKKE